MAEAIEGRQLFAGGPHPHGWGPPGGFDGPHAEFVLVMPFTAVAMMRAAADAMIADAAADAVSDAAAFQSAARSAALKSASTDVTANIMGNTATTGAGQVIAAMRAANERSAGRAVPITGAAAAAAKSGEVAVRHADGDDAVPAAVDAANPTNPTVTAAPATSGDPSGLTFGPFKVTTAIAASMAASTASGPKLTWVASGPSAVLRPQVTPAVAPRTTTNAKAVDATPDDMTIVDAAVTTQTAALGLPTDGVAGRPLWQRISAAVAGVTLVAVNYVVRRRRRQGVAAGMVR